MPDSFCHIAVHIVFGTKSRERFIDSSIEYQLHKYIAGIIANHNGVCMQINGMDDHVHILMLMPKDMNISQVVRTLKSSSSKWIRETFDKAFAWQTGYGAFSVSRSQVAKVVEYIRDQKQHHRRTSFQDEFESLLNHHILTDQ